MRFIGNKEAMMPEIYKLLEDKKLVNKGYTLFDAFTGTGAVADYLKDSFDIKVNDLLTWTVIYTRGRLYADKCTFNTLGFDPIEYFNKNEKTINGFFYDNYSPGSSERMYFNKYNAARIDYFRITIEEWYQENLISENEYYFLLASLLESISLVANVAGVYGAFLKHWDPRALKDIQFVEVMSKSVSEIPKASFYNSKIEDIIDEVDCDVLYLDPPYTQNQYGTQYHLLETLVLYDEPTISPVTGSRKTGPMRSDWSKNFKSHILLDKIIAETNAKYIVLSYSIDGFMSKKFIEAIFKRYGKEETYTCRKISYPKYRNSKTRRKNNHYEYLFFIEKKDINEVAYESPLNYSGNKHNLINQLKPLMPKKINRFIDLFGGGFNVGINIDSQKIIYNDINFFVKDLVESFNIYDTYDYLMYIRRTEKKYELEINDSESYLKARSYYNSLPTSKKDPRLLYTIILYGFNQQIRFNNNHEFNNPVGMRWFNDNILEKLISFSRISKEKNIDYKSLDFLDLKSDIIDGHEDTFVYMDPPYRLTTSSYNDGKRGFNGWTITQEKELMNFIDELNKKNIKFMMSYVLEHNGESNNRIQEWLNNRDYQVHELQPISKNGRKEVVIINYDIL